MLEHAYAVIMAGGRGERFWPLSTSKHPKQVLSLLGNKTLVGMAVSYLKGLIPPSRILVITSADLVNVTRKAAPELPGRNVIGEPFGRDTAAVCALASAIIKSRDPAASFCVITADHIIKDLPLFRRTLREGFKLAASQDVLITIGIKPTCPNTGFGYIEVASERSSQGGIRFFEAKRFVEKPDRVTAEKYVASKSFFWNAGMFVWSVANLQRALGKHAPNLLDMAVRMEKVADTGKFAAALKKEYGKLEKISIDYALMEKSRNIVTAAGTFRWDDVGSWPSLENHIRARPDGNVVLGSAELLDASGNLVVAGRRLTALIGVKDLVVVQAEGATLVCAKNRAQDVKNMVKLLAGTGKYKALL